MRRPIAIAAVAAVGVVAATVAITVGRPHRSPGGAGGPAPPAQPAGPGAGPTAGAGARSQAGAVAAALAVATASQDWLYLADPAMADAVAAVSTAGAGPALAAQTVDGLGRSRDALAASTGPVWWVVRPLATRVEHVGPDRARVVVWTVTVLSAADVALPQADWLRVAVDLAWEAGAWRAEAVTDTAGPTPVTGAKDQPWTAAAFDNALEGFQRVGTSTTKGAP